MRFVHWMAVLAVAAAVGGLALAATSGASAPPRYSVTIQAVYDRAGNPSLVANFSPDGSLAKARWAICPPPDTTVCTPTRHVVFLTPGPSAPGTVFEARAIYKSRTYVARTPPWRGAVRATAAPRVSGPARYGARVTPRAATWAGGWPRNFDYLRVEACRTRTATRCVSLNAPEYGFGRPPVVSDAFTGWFLFAFDERLPHDTAIGLPGLFWPNGAPPLKPGPTVARSAPVGPVVGPRPPRVAILRTAILSGGRVLVARVGCSVRCHVWVQVAGRDSIPDARVTLTGSALVGVSRARLGRSRGRLRISLFVDGGPVMHGESRVG